MIRELMLLLLTLTLSLFILTFCQAVGAVNEQGRKKSARSQHPVSAKNSKVEQEILRLQEELVQAMARCDHQALERLMAADRVNITPSGQVREMNDWLPQSKKDCKPYQPAALEDMQVKIFGGTAIVIGRITIHRQDGTSMPPARFSSVWVKSDRRWREVSYQGTPIKETATELKSGQPTERETEGGEIHSYRKLGRRLP
jgi:ketosteroid isomerase-like protein